MYFFGAYDSQTLGRLDPSMMSQEALLETFLDGVQHKGRFLDEHGNYNFTGQDFDYEDGEIIKNVYLESPEGETVGLGGSVNFLFLPLSVKVLSLDNNFLQGSVEVENWPPSIEAVYLDNNKFHGSIETSELPRTLADFRCRTTSCVAHSI